MGILGSEQLRTRISALFTHRVLPNIATLVAPRPRSGYRATDVGRITISVWVESQVGQGSTFHLTLLPRQHAF